MDPSPGGLQDLEARVFQGSRPDLLAPAGRTPSRSSLCIDPILQPANPPTRFHRTKRCAGPAELPRCRFRHRGETGAGGGLPSALSCLLCALLSCFIGCPQQAGRLEAVRVSRRRHVQLADRLQGRGNIVPAMSDCARFNNPDSAERQTHRCLLAPRCSRNESP